MNLYLQSGVNLEEAGSFVQGIGSIATKTFDKNTVGSIGGFAGLYKLPGGYTNPILVACTDGVGSKLKLAYENNKLQNIGQDLVAMCVNDLLCVGAKPLYFLDYLATEKLDKTQALTIAESIANACIECETVLLGGETAELPGMLPKDGYELAGFCTGIVEEEKILSSENTNEGDILIGLPSSGIHSNGYSLVRHIIEKNNLDLNEKYGLEETLIDELLKPTELYTRTVNPLLDKVNSIAHITGGGLLENLPRVISKDFYADINKNSWEIPKIFEFMREQGKISEEEIYKVFNMGLGMILIISPSNKNAVCDYLNKHNKKYFEIGSLKSKSNIANSSLDKNTETPQVVIH